MKHEIHIWEVLDLETNSKRPKQTLIITDEQLSVIEQFASTRKDAELNTIYKLNDCEFKIYPHFASPIIHVSEFNSQLESFNIDGDIEL